MCNITNVERPNYGIDYIKTDFKSGGICTLPEESTSHSKCTGYRYGLNHYCAYRNYSNSNCLRPENRKIDTMERVTELNDPGVSKSKYIK